MVHNQKDSKQNQEEEEKVKQINSVEEKWLQILKTDKIHLNID